MGIRRVKYFGLLGIFSGLLFSAAAGAKDWSQKQGCAVKPVVEERTIFTMQCDRFQRETTLRAQALDTKSGISKWETILPGNAPHAISHIQIHKKHLFLGVTENRRDQFGRKVVFQHFLALDKRNGVVLWDKQIPGVLSSQPQFVNGLLYITTTYKKFAATQNALIALDLTNGYIAWKKWIVTEKRSKFQLSPVHYKGLMIVSTRDMIYAYSAKDGTLVWQLQPKQEDFQLPKLYEYSQLYMYKGSVYVGFNYGDQAYVLSVEAESGIELWRSEVKGFVRTGPIARDGRVVMVTNGRGNNKHGYVSAFSTEDGDLKWQQVIKPIGKLGSTHFFQPPVYHKGVIYAVTGASALESFVVAISLRKGHMIWKRKLSNQAISPLHVESGRVFIGTQVKAELVVFRTKDGALLWRKVLIGSPINRAQLGSGKVIVTTSNTLHAFDLK